MYDVLDAFDPMRAPDSLAQRVESLLAEQLLPSRLFDRKVVWDYWRFRQAWDAATSESRRNRIQLSCPAIALAYRLRQHRETDLPALVEAQLLARRSDDIIAQFAGTIPAAIHAYEQLFFRVRDRLEAWGWVFTVAVGGGLSMTAKGKALTEDEHRRRLYRLLGYSGGPAVLDAVLGATRSSHAGQGSNGEEWCAQQLRCAVPFQAMLAINTTAHFTEIAGDSMTCVW